VATQQLPGLRERGALLGAVTVGLDALVVFEGELRKPWGGRQARVGGRRVYYGNAAWWGWASGAAVDTAAHPVLQRILQRRPPQTLLTMVRAPPAAFTAQGVRRFAAVREETFLGAPMPLRLCPPPQT
jgi:hypothetical protein